MRTPSIGRRARRSPETLARVIAWRERRLLRELETKLRRIADAPRAIPSDEISVVRDAVRAFRDAFRAPRALMVWDIPDEPYVNIAYAERDRVDVSQEPPGTFAPLVDPELGEATLFTAPEQTLYSGPSGARKVAPGPGALHRDLVARFEISSALVVRVESAALEGRLFALDLKRVARFDFILAELIAAMTAARSEHVGQVAVARNEAVEAERSRVARDLHDGLLQSFTGIVLQLETAHDLLDRDPLQARRRITEIEASLMNDQRELRSYVDELRPRARRRSTEFDFQGRVAELRERFAREWNLRLEVDLGPMHPLVTQALGQETFRMIAEAVTNAAKHGQAARVNVYIATREDRLWIRVQDDGIGFSFRGRYNLATLMERQQGPLTLAERVAALNGDITVDSTEDGATLEISLPLGWRA